MVFTNETCIKNPLYTELYKVGTIYSHESSGYVMISRILHTCDPNLVSDNGDLHTYISTLDLKNENLLKTFTILYLVFDQILDSLVEQYLPPE